MLKEKRQNRKTLLVAMERLIHEPYLALKSGWLHIVMGLTAGFGLVILANDLSRNAPFRFGIVTVLIEHLGIGFIVASIALFFYEWRGQQRKTDALIAKLSDAIDNSSSEALDRSLRSILGKGGEIPPQYVRDAIVDIKALVEVVGHLENESRWVGTLQISMLSKLIRDVRQNAESLTMLNRRGETLFRVPRAEELVDKILAAQMQTMGTGDKYDVVSGLGDWKGLQLRMLQQATEEAILQRNIAVRRIFSIFDYEGLTSVEARDVLLRHLGYVTELESKRGGGYQVRLVRDGELERSTSMFLRDRVKHANFGIFSHGPEKLRVMMDKADLSDLTISSDPESVELYSNLFLELWKLARPLTKELITDIMERDYRDIE